MVGSRKTVFAYVCVHESDYPGVRRGVRQTGPEGCVQTASPTGVVTGGTEEGPEGLLFDTCLTAVLGHLESGRTEAPWEERRRGLPPPVVYGQMESRELTFLDRWRATERLRAASAGQTAASMLWLFCPCLVPGLFLGFLKCHGHLPFSANCSWLSSLDFRDGAGKTTKNQPGIGECKATGCT